MKTQSANAFSKVKNEQSVKFVQSQQQIHQNKSSDVFINNFEKISHLISVF